MTSIGNNCQAPQFGDAYGAPATAGAGPAPQASGGPDLSALLGGAGGGLGASPAPALQASAGPSVGMGAPAFGCGQNLNTLA